jgi:hypothetical protein
MTTLEAIINELAVAPESLLLEVANFIKSAKVDTAVVSDRLPRAPGLHQGKVWMSDDFNDSLPDEFWLGEMDSMIYRCTIKIHSIGY